MEKRKLNMQEKRKVEKLLFADIDSARSKYLAVRRKEHDEIANKLAVNPPKEVKQLLTEHQAARARLKLIEKDLAKQGFSVGYDDKLRVSSYDAPPMLADFDAETAGTDQQFLDLKRDYTLRLYAGDEESKDLFKQLTNALAKIAK